MRRNSLIGIGLAVVAAMGLAAPAASAAPSRAATSVGDGSDPNDTGCASSAWTQYSVPNPTGIGGTLELRYSLSCSTAWARFTCEQDPNGFGCSSYKIYVRRDQDGVNYGVTVSFPTSTPINHQLYTRQLNDGVGQSAKACFYNTASGVTACTASY